MADVAVVTAPPLATVANVELMHTGTWQLASGEATFSVADLASAVAALDCPAVRRPILKFGHTPNPAPGQPAVGFVGNMATAENGRTLVGDYVGLPGWLATQDDAGNSVISSAYPDRSVEAEYDFRCQLGHTHPFVVTAVALLGDEAPGIGTLQSLQDLADLYGVAAQSSPAGTPVTITVRAAQEDRMPNPRAAQVAAGVSTEDVRRAFYASPAGAGWSSWIEEMQLEPLQLIVMDDTSGTRSRVPVTVGDGDGEEAVSFGDAVKVVIRYDDAPATAAAAAGRSLVRYASREESRPGNSSAPAAKAAGLPTQRKGAGMNLAKYREALAGLPDDASEEDTRKALASAGFTPSPPTTGEPQQLALTDPPADPAPEGEPVKIAASGKSPGTMTIDQSAWDEREERIRRLEASAARQRRDERDQVVASAVSEGKFPPARKEHWVRLWDADPEGTRQVIAGLARNVVPVNPLGYAGDIEGDDIDAEFEHLFPPTAGKGR